MAAFELDKSGAFVIDISVQGLEDEIFRIASSANLRACFAAKSKAAVTTLHKIWAGLIAGRTIAKIRALFRTFEMRTLVNTVFAAFEADLATFHWAV